MYYEKAAITDNDKKILERLKTDKDTVRIKKAIEIYKHYRQQEKEFDELNYKDQVIYINEWVKRNIMTDKEIKWFEENMMEKYREKIQRKKAE